MNTSINLQETLLLQKLFALDYGTGVLLADDILHTDLNNLLEQGAIEIFTPENTGNIPGMPSLVGVITLTDHVRITTSGCTVLANVYQKRWQDYFNSIGATVHTIAH